MASRPNDLAPSRGGVSPAAVVTIVAGLIVVVGSFTTWATASAGIFAQSVNGTENGGDGWLTLGCGGIGALVGLLCLGHRRTGWGVVGLLAFLAGVAISGYDMSNLSGSLSTGIVQVDVTPGFGLWFCLIGSIAGAVATWYAAFRGPVRAGPLATTMAAGMPTGLQAPMPPPRGWFPDPRGQHRFRWYDGTRWTESVSD